MPHHFDEKEKTMTAPQLSLFQATDLPHLDYLLPEHQARFANVPREIFATHATLPTDKLPVVIRYQGMPIGFFILDTGDDVAIYSPNPNAVLLRAYSLNPAYQGQGLAQMSLSAGVLLPFFRQHFGDADELVLAVNHANVSAQKLYLTTGFQDSGRRVQGTFGEQYVYVLKIKKN